MRDLADPTIATLIVADALRRAGLEGAVYGGLALAAYGEPRETKDADFAVASLDQVAVIEALRAAGVDAEAGFDRVRFGGNDISRIALLGARDASGLNVLDLVRPRSPRFAAGVIERALTGSIAGGEVRLVAPEDFVVLKLLSTRDRDLEDAASVVRELGTRIDAVAVEREARELALETPDFDVLARWTRMMAGAR